jgi:hypothetical protein
MNTGGVPAFEHPETYKPTPKKIPTSGERADISEVEHLKQRHGRMLRDSGERPTVGRDGSPNLSAGAGASGHVGARELESTERAKDGRRD